MVPEKVNRAALSVFSLRMPAEWKGKIDSEGVRAWLGQYFRRPVALPEDPGSGEARISLSLPERAVKTFAASLGESDSGALRRLIAGQLGALPPAAPRTLEVIVHPSAPAFVAQRSPSVPALRREVRPLRLAQPSSAAVAWPEPTMTRAEHHSFMMLHDPFYRGQFELQQHNERLRKDMTRRKGGSPAPRFSPAAVAVALEPVQVSSLLYSAPALVVGCVALGGLAWGVWKFLRGAGPVVKAATVATTAVSSAVKSAFREWRPS